MNEDVEFWRSRALESERELIACAERAHAAKAQEFEHLQFVVKSLKAELAEARRNPNGLKVVELDLYPITIEQDRYGGSYSGGAYLAFAAYSDDYYDRHDASDGDPDCHNFWYEGWTRENPVRKDRDWVAVGDTPHEALENLLRKHKDNAHD